MTATDRIAEILSNSVEDDVLAVISKKYSDQISEGNIPGHLPLNKFGYNGAVGATDEEVWDGAVAYPYLAAGEILKVSSNDVDDQGDELSAGTATGGTVSTLIDAAATFATDTVAAGDLVIDDDNVQHGIVLSLTGETQINLVLPLETSLDGVAYRVINANDTGAAVIKLFGLDDNYDELSEYVVMATAASVATVGTYLRVFRAMVILSGSSNVNEGNIAIKDNADAVLLAQITALKGQTQMALWTVPDGYTAYINGFYGSSSVAAKATEVMLFVKNVGESWQLKKPILLNSSGAQIVIEPALQVLQRAEVVIRANAAAGSGIVAAGFDGWYEANS